MNLTASYDPAKDAENHVRCIFDAAYLAHGREGMREKLLAAVESDEVRSALVGGGERDVMLVKVTELLAAAPGRDKLGDAAWRLEKTWATRGDQVILQLETLFVRDWPFDRVHVDLTTLPICPYNFMEKRIFVRGLAPLEAQLRILAHELNHFLFYHAYADDLAPKLGYEKFELLKESVTVFTNPEHSGKPDEAPLRKLFIEKRVRSLDEAVRIGTDYLSGRA
jgi:hypothetical protein